MSVERKMVAQTYPQDPNIAFGYMTAPASKPQHLLPYMASGFKSTLNMSGPRDSLAQVCRMEIMKLLSEFGHVLECGVCQMDTFGQR